MGSQVAQYLREVLCLQAKTPLLQYHTMVIALVLQVTNAPVQHELPKSTRATADFAVDIHTVHDEVKPYAQHIWQRQ